MKRILKESWSWDFISEILLWSSVVLLCPTTAIVHNPYQVSPGSTGASSHQVGVVAGPNPSWAPAAVAVVNANYYLNQQCHDDDGCFPSRTLLYCISYKCQCITQGATFINNYFYNYNMEWNESVSQCMSQSGSPCTLKRYWYSPDILRMDCVQGHECVELSSAAAKATISAQTLSGYGSSVPAQQNSQRQHQWHPHLIPYFGSGVSSLSGSSAQASQNVQTSQRQGFEGGAAAAASASTSASNTWGICVPTTRITHGSGLVQAGQHLDNSNGRQVPVSMISLITFCLWIIGIGFN